MKQIEFNLLDEPWIRVMTQDCTVHECTLKQTLLESHGFLRLAGETPTQDVAMLRLLLAVLHTVFYRVNEDGEEDPAEDERTAVARWRGLWSAGRLPEKPIVDYLEAWHDRFWLFHPERPFYQTPGADIGTAYEASKLNGELSESSNKPRLFPSRTGENKRSLSYAESARWLLYVNGFDDTSAKPKKKGLPSPGAGWLGKLGPIYAEGGSLFETLMLNLVLLGDGNEPWGEPKPVWEREKPKSEERTEIAMPDNQAELLTLQSRRLLLERQAGAVVGYKLLGGDFFPKINATPEQMTLWDRRETKKNEPPYDQPKRLDANRMMWRDFGVLTGAGGNGRAPGVVSWTAYLKRKGVLSRKQVIRFRTAGLKYGDKDFFVEDIITDHLDFRAALLDDVGLLWTKLIQSMISKTETGAEHIRKFAAGLCRAAGCQPENEEQRAVQEYYGAVDIPFREWLLSVDPEKGDGEELLNEKERQWRRKAYTIARRQGEKMLRSAGQAAFAGRWVENSKNKDKKIFCCSSGEFNIFAGSIRKCFGIRTAKKEEADD